MKKILTETLFIIVLLCACVIFWTFGFISEFTDICLSFAAIATPIIAFSGLKTWQQELRGKAYFELARSLIRATYKLRDTLQTARNPTQLTSEWLEGYDPLSKNPKVTERENNSHFYTNRWKPVAEAVRELEAQQFEAEVLWGMEIKNKIEELIICAHLFSVSMDMKINEDEIAKTAPDPEEYRDDLKNDKLYNDLKDNISWNGIGDADTTPLGKRITVAVKEIKEQLSLYI